MAARHATWQRKTVLLAVALTALVVTLATTQAQAPKAAPISTSKPMRRTWR